MKKKMSMIFGFALLACMVVSMIVSATSATIYLPKDTWVSISGERGGDYSFVPVRVDSVYPTDHSEDNYTTIKVRLIATTTNEILCPTQTINETDTSYTRLSIKEGYLNTKKVTVQFKGNKPELAAYAVVQYYFW